MERAPRRRAEVNWVVIDGDVVLSDPLSGEIHVLSGATSATWQLIDGEPLDGFAELIASEFDVPLIDACADLAASVEQLRSLGVVHD